jgi:hypothetical protein
MKRNYIIVKNFKTIESSALSKSFLYLGVIFCFLKMGASVNIGFNNLPEASQLMLFYPSNKQLIDFDATTIII